MFRILIGLCIIAASLAGTVFHSGVPIPDGRIVGGENAAIEDYPYQISLRRNGNHICGGSVLATNKVLTAAHCVAGAQPSQLSIKGGSSTLKPPYPTLSQELSVSHISIHGEYNAYTNDYDFAVLTTNDHFVYNENVKPIELAEERAADGALVTTSGWGTLSEGGNFLPNNLQKVDVNVVGNDECQSSYPFWLVSDSMMCAGVENGGKDACQGDSGGPIVYDGKLIGVVSWGYGCARDEYPGVYGSVPNERKWIMQQ